MKILDAKASLEDFFMSKLRGRKNFQTNLSWSNDDARMTDCDTFLLFALD